MNFYFIHKIQDGVLAVILTNTSNVAFCIITTSLISSYA